MHHNSSRLITWASWSRSPAWAIPGPPWCRRTRWHPRSWEESEWNDIAVIFLLDEGISTCLFYYYSVGSKWRQECTKYLSCPSIFLKFVFVRLSYLNLLARRHVRDGLPRRLARPRPRQRLDRHRHPEGGDWADMVADQADQRRRDVGVGLGAAWKDSIFIRENIVKPNTNKHLKMTEGAVVGIIRISLGIHIFKEKKESLI